MTTEGNRSQSAGDIAIVGMAVDLPGAGDLAVYWTNLRDGVRSIRHLSEEDLRAAGEDPARMRHPNYVPAAADLEDFDRFDAEFFGFSPKDAAILDPQHRKFLEVAWQAMEQAGHPPQRIAGRDVGVYAGCGMGNYFYVNIRSNPDLMEDVGDFLLRHTGNDKDFLSTRVSHFFDLRGPSINLQTACSTSLVAVHYACQALRAGEVGMAVAGGVTIELPQGRGYLFRENEILSPDGKCHAFDHRAQGTVFGSGAGAVALRRLEDALADGDHIWAVIKGSAVNNDGADKAGYLAPSVEGQTTAIARAMDDAGVAAESIGYVECHGTGTYLGDPIEVAALTQAFRQGTDAADFCRIGSVKTNIGHLDTAAGVAGLVKAALALHHAQIPPSLGYEAPNPAIAFDGSPFSVAQTLQDWPALSGPRRAGVNALGVGGTNAHVILEQAPERAAPQESDWPFQPICISGRTEAALDANAKALAAHLRAHPEQPLADVAYTLKEGRHAFAKRRVLVAHSPQEAADLLETGEPQRVFGHDALAEGPGVVFMFPGGGAQYPGMARDLYETEPVFGEWMDRGLDHLQPQIDVDIRALWLARGPAAEQAEARLRRPSLQLPLIMIAEYALARLWLSWGIQPAAMVGHSMGENVAACLAGVMSFEDCIDLVLLRGQLFDSVPEGGMISVSASRSDIAAHLGPDLDLAGVNGAELVTVSGPRAALGDLEKRLDAADIDWQPVHIDIAAHSRMLDPILDRYRDFLCGIDLSAPRITVMSNRTGEPLTPEQATDPDYWVAQLRQPVMFADCLTRLAAEGPRVYLEVGPGRTLGALAGMHGDIAPAQVLNTLRHPTQEIEDDAWFVGTVARLWACGVEADWAHIWGTAGRHRVVLPTYAFQRARYFIEPGVQAVFPPVAEPGRIDDIGHWGHVPRWRQRHAAGGEEALEALAEHPQRWLMFMDRSGLAQGVAARLRDAGHEVIEVIAGDAFAQVSPHRFALAPEQGRAGYAQLLAALEEADRLPERIGHFWLAEQNPWLRPGSSAFDRNIEQGYWSVTWLGQALAETMPEAPVHLTVFTCGAVSVRDEVLSEPEKAMVVGPAGVLPREVSGLTCAIVDIEAPAEPEAAEGWLSRWIQPGGGAEEEDDAPLTGLMLEELLADPRNLQAAHRGSRRYELSYRALTLPEASAAEEAPLYSDGGVYLITGGFGGIGQALAADILQDRSAHVVLLSRSALPPRAEWDDLLSSTPAGDGTARRIRAFCRLEALAAKGGGSVTLATADVVNLAQMRRVIGDLTERFGGITGVIHAAGRLHDAPLLGKTDAAMEAVLAPKVQGLRVLDRLLPDGTLDWMVLFSSTSTAIRAAGQADYVAANAWLDAYAQARRGGRTRVVTINWGVWADTGMAARLLPGRPADVLPARRLEGAGVLESVQTDRKGAPVYETTLHSGVWMLDDHRTADGRMVLPGTGYVELLAEAARAQGLKGFEIADLHFLRPLELADDEERALRVILQPGPDGFTAEVRSACRLNGRAAWQLHAEAHLSPRKTPQTRDIDPGAIRARCPLQEKAPEAGHLTSPQEAHLAFGPRWHVLRETALGKGEGIARLSLPRAFADDVAAGHLLHAGLMDLATGWAVSLIDSYTPAHLWVPVSYGSIMVHGPLTGRLWSWVRTRGRARDGDGVFDVTICDDWGHVLVELRGFAMTRLAGRLKAPALTERDVTFAEDGRETPELTPQEQKFAALLRNGIRGVEGPGALRRAMAAGLPQVIVSSMPLSALIAQADMPVAAPAKKSRSFERTDVDDSFIAPRPGIEADLAEIWESLLGVSPVGAQDSFFDLGGHSLIAVRLFAAIKRRFGVEFPISTLFEAPTITLCAALIAEETGQNAGAGDDNAPAALRKPEASSPPVRHAHLVPLNQGREEEAPALFIVAGMFGNVLNLRHLAMSFSGERPVWGIQARGLIGDEPPHETVPDAARDYLTEVRQVQPKGPYLLAGYSGGGITAYEMARQLRDAGEEVAVLAMLDTPLPLRPPLQAQDKALIKLQQIREAGPRYALDWFRERRAWKQLQEERELTGSDSPAPGGAEFNNRKMEDAFIAATSRYVPPRWEGPITLFRPPLERRWKGAEGRWISSERHYVWPDNGWRAHAPRVEVIEVPGDHDSMVLTPNVTVLAQELAEVIRTALHGAQGAASSRTTAAE